MGTTKKQAFMKPLIFLALILLCACKQQDSKIVAADDTVVSGDTVLTADPSVQIQKNGIVYGNKRFRDVTVEKLPDGTFHIQGEAQIFEANFSWVLEDGHNELDKGHEMTDVGAPDWGKFSFTIDSPKKEENTTLHLILFEISAKDGSRQHELAILLDQ